MFLACSALLALGAWIALGCGSTVSLRVRRAVPLPSERNATLLAGVGKADITPRPGMPTTGYATNGNSGTGFRTRLYARVIYLKAVNRKPVALVQCDLLAGSELVHRMLAERVAQATDLDLGGITMSGTHTHSGPGNLQGNNFYVMHAGNAGGLDLAFLEFVAGRIAGAIVDAYNDRRPARLATGSAEVHGFTRNRSISAYRANRNADAGKGNDIHEAVNAEMHMVRVDCRDAGSGAYEPAGVLTSFSIHGTAVPARNTLYNADVFAYMERELEWEVARTRGGTRFVHAVVNGTHGDNAPDCAGACRGFRDARRLGTGLGRKAVELFDSLAGALTADVEVRAALREIDYYRTNAVDGIAICDPPRVGNTLLAGAGDGGPTPVLSWLPFFREGSRRWLFTGGCQGNKRITAWPLQSLVLPRDEFPHVITYQAVQLGNVVLLPLPYEVTMESGRRIAEACRRSARDGGMGAGTRFVVVSVSNGYTGYCTTPEEYGEQRYEGGHTLYGPNTAPFVAAQAARLVGDMAAGGDIRDLLAKEWTFDLTGKTFYRDDEAPRGRRAAIAEPSRCRAEGGEECWSFGWADVPPSRIDLHRRLVSIERSEDGVTWVPLEERGIPVDDDGYDLSVAFTGDFTAANLGIYETRWYNPERKEGRRYRFRIEPRPGQEELFSEAFR